MLRDIAAAQKSIYLEQYIFKPDAVGMRFIDALVHKANEGVHVRLLIDSLGSYFLLLDSRALAKLSAAGIEVRWYHRVFPLALNTFGSWFFRDHRKLLIVDDAIVHIGDEGLNASMADWRSTHARVVGPVAEEARLSFVNLWLKSRIPTPHVVHKPRPQELSDFEFVPNTPAPRKRYLYHAMRNAIINSRERIWITVPYFIPDIRIFRSLRLRAHSGVDVRLLVPGRCDRPILDDATRSYFGMALRSGIKVYLYQERKLHAKVMVCDDNWATFGTMNWDSLSFRYNLEANLVTSNKSCVAELASHFLEDMAHTEPVSYAAWQSRPWLQRAKEVALWPLHPVL